MLDADHVGRDANHVRRRMYLCIYVSIYLYIYLSCVCFNCIYYFSSSQTRICLFVSLNSPLSSTTMLTRSLSRALSTRQWHLSSKCNHASWKTTTTMERILMGVAVGQHNWNQAGEWAKLLTEDCSWESSSSSNGEDDNYKNEHCQHVPSFKIWKNQWWSPLPSDVEDPSN